MQALSPTLTDVDFRKNPLLQVKVDSVWHSVQPSHNRCSLFRKVNLPINKIYVRVNLYINMYWEFVMVHSVRQTSFSFAGLNATSALLNETLAYGFTSDWVFFIIHIWHNYHAFPWNSFFYWGHLLIFIARGTNPINGQSRWYLMLYLYCLTFGLSLQAPKKTKSHQCAP